MEDAEMIDLLVEGSPPVHMVAVTTQLPPGVPRETIVTNLQMFTRVWRAKVPAILSHNVFNHYFDKLLQVCMWMHVCVVWMKMVNVAPCTVHLSLDIVFFLSTFSEKSYVNYVLLALVA